MSVPVEQDKPLLVVVGPTGSGKSALALHLAERFEGEIVNCDSVQVYRDLDTGSGKLPVSARRSIPHHLLDVAGPAEDYTAGDYARQARAALAEISDRGKLPIVAGGTGFYLRALLWGLSPAPKRQQDLRERLSQLAVRRPEALHRALRRLDPEAAGRIHANDHQKLIRALELAYVRGHTGSGGTRPPRDPLRGYRILKLGLNPPRHELRGRIDRRTLEMFRHGLIEETRALLSEGYGADQRGALQSLGYKQAQLVLTGALDRASAIRECQTRTRQYAKRQMTWFRSDPDIRWLTGFGDDAEVAGSAVAMVRAFLDTASPAAARVSGPPAGA